MLRRSFLSLAAALPAITRAQSSPRPPNIVFILADDVGYGDVGCYGATRVKTPNIDRLAAQGIRFTDAHSTSSTCTPSRYSLMTGQYAWRKKGTGILPGDARLIIDPERATLPSVLKSAGYTTAAVGKWHLGLGNGNVDWNAEIHPGPREVGFDYSFIMPATGDRVPCVYLENSRVVGLDPKDPIEVNYQHKIGNEPTGKEHPELLKMKLSEGHADTIVNGISRIGFMSGGKAALWNDSTMGQTLTQKATGFIEKNRANPFFVYLATHDIHVPRVPNGKFLGTTACGLRCDAIAQLDWTVGQVMATLKANRLEENTLLIFSSDNGPVVDDGYADGSVENLNGHTPANRLRGGKYSIYEGGTRLPFIASWPGRIRPGVSDALISQVDMTASLAGLASAKIPEGSAPDSQNVLPAILGDSKQGREMLVEHSGGIALRQGNWKYIPAQPQANGPRAKQPDRIQPATPELYDLSKDIGERQNVIAANAERAEAMRTALEKIKG
jgi:arylsulfatase A-like enzyme